jgi:hypothetical protein
MSKAQGLAAPNPQPTILESKSVIKPQHNQVLRSKFRCIYCRRYFPYPLNLRRHIATHDDLSQAERNECYKFCDLFETVVTMGFLI